MTIPWDWKDSKLYEHLGSDTSGEQWVWEFVRRDLVYQEAWQKILIKYEEALKKLEMQGVEISEQESNIPGVYTTDFYNFCERDKSGKGDIIAYGIRGKRGRHLLDFMPVEVSEHESLFLILSDRCLRLLVNPQISFESFPKGLLEEIFQEASGLWWMKEFGSIEERVKGSSFSRNQVLWLFNLELPVPYLLKQAENFLERFKKLLADDGKRYRKYVTRMKKIESEGIRKELDQYALDLYLERPLEERRSNIYRPTAKTQKKTERDFEGWRRRLRILDAISKKPIANYQEIGDILNPSHENPYKWAWEEAREAKRDAGGRIRSALL